MSLAERAREAVRERPFLHEGLRAGVVNYSAAAAYLDVGDQSAVAAALRRYAEELDDPGALGDARVRMESGLAERDASEAEDETEALLVVGDTALSSGGGSLTAILATGTLSMGGLRAVVGRCDVADIDLTAVGFDGETLVVVVERRDGPDALRIVESAFA
jgi:hypothetical protein